MCLSIQNLSHFGINWFDNRGVNFEIIKIKNNNAKTKTANAFMMNSVESRLETK